MEVELSREGASSFGFSLRGTVYPFFVEKVDDGAWSRGGMGVCG